MKQVVLICSLSLFLVAQALGQPSGNKNQQQLMAFQDSLKQISYKMVNDSIEPERYNASFKLIKTLVSALKIPYSFNFPFDSIKSISIQSSSDKRFRIFGWHVMNNDGSYRYYGTIQMNKPDGKLELFPLIDYTSVFKNPSDSATTHDKWFGAQYYKIISVLNNVPIPYYVLLGWKGNTIKSTKKII